MNDTRPEFEHLTLTEDASGVVTLTLDVADRVVNVLGEAVLAEFADAVAYLARTRPRALVLRSAKDAGFAAGADVEEFTKIAAAAEAAARMSEVHAVLRDLERLPCPTVAAIRGHCLGGGLEIALACDRLVATDEPATRLGFPEVLLGIHPGFGGSARSIGRAGAVAAMDLMLTGRTVSARAARRIGLVDAAVPVRQFERAVRHYASEYTRAPRLSRRKAVANTTVTRPLVAAMMRRRVARQATREHYPAPYALIDLFERFGGDRDAMLEAEVRSDARLFVSDTSRALVRLYFLRERLKALGRGEDDFEPRRVHVVGAGAMGGDIAAWAAYKGFDVTLEDLSARDLAPAIGRAAKLFSRRLKSSRDVTAALDRLVPDPAGHGVARADIVIEAVVEDREVKCDLLRGIERRARSDALLATNTSSLPLPEIADALEAPERLVGLHFFNPVARMQLVEVIASAATAKTAARRASAFAVALDRMPLPVASSPGFLVNRILVPYLNEAICMLDEGVGARAIDAAARQFGMPMGPVELADTVGLDICLSVGRTLAATVGADVPPSLERKVADGDLGVKTGRGFYVHKGRRKQPVRHGDSTLDAHEIQMRLALQIVNESLACLREGVVADRDLVDAGMVFGTGFAPFRGGPMAWLEQAGRDSLFKRMRDYEEKYGPRFAPDEAWQMQRLSEPRS